MLFRSREGTHHHFPELHISPRPGHENRPGHLNQLHGNFSFTSLRVFLTWKMKGNLDYTSKITELYHVRGSYSNWNGELCFENKKHPLEGELIQQKNETSKHLLFHAMKEKTTKRSYFKQQTRQWKLNGAYNNISFLLTQGMASLHHVGVTSGGEGGPKYCTR